MPNHKDSRNISRAKGHLKEADEMADRINNGARVEDCRPPEYFLEKSLIKTQMGILQESERQTDALELQALTAFYAIDPETLTPQVREVQELAEQGILDRVNRIIERPLRSFPGAHLET